MFSNFEVWSSNGWVVWEKKGIMLWSFVYAIIELEQSVSVLSSLSSDRIDWCSSSDFSQPPCQVKKSHLKMCTISRCSSESTQLLLQRGTYNCCRIRVKAQNRSCKYKTIKWKNLELLNTCIQWDIACASIVKRKLNIFERNLECYWHGIGISWMFIVQCEQRIVALEIPGRIEVKRVW